MTMHEMVVEMKLLERRLTLYEEKYGVLSEDFYRALTAGELARFDEYDETRMISAVGRVSTRPGSAGNSPTMVRSRARISHPPFACSLPIDDGDPTLGSLGAYSQF